MVDLAAHFGDLPFTRTQALIAGLTAHQWRLLTHEKTLIPLTYGVYCLQRPSDDRARLAQRTSAFLLRKTDHFAVSSSALAILELPSPYFCSWDRMPIAIAGKQTRGRAGVRRSAAAPIPTPWGLCTDLLDTAATIAAELPLPQALMVTDVIARRLAGSEDRFVLASERCRTEVRRRLTHRVDLPALQLADPAVESPAESFFRGYILQAGFPEPRCGVPMKGASGSQYFIDMVLEGLLVEVDGRGKYKNLEVLIDEKRREDDLRATGRGFHRTFVEDLYTDPAVEVARLTDRLRLALPA